MRTFDELLDDLVHRARWERDEVESAKKTLRAMRDAAVAAERERRARAPLTESQIDDMLADANRGFCIERDDYIKAVRDAELAHGIWPNGDISGAAGPPAGSA